MRFNSRKENLTPKLALAASKLSLRHALPMADAIILATAQAFVPLHSPESSKLEQFS